MRFQRSQPAGHRKPPPDYLSRRVQRRLLYLLGSFFLVLFLMSQARNPENYRWMWHLNESKKPAAPADAPRASNQEPVDVLRLPLPNQKQPGQDNQIGKDWLLETQIDGWGRVFEQLSRSETNDLQTGLLLVREGQGLTGPLLARWPALQVQLDQQWNQYHSQALVELAQDAPGTDEQKPFWLTILDRSRQTWSEYASSLALLADGTVPQGRQRELLDALQHTLDQFALRQVEDNTVSRPQEQMAWLRMLEQARRASHNHTQISPERVNYLQLMNQPEYYRGKWISISGEARWGYHTTASTDQFGFDGYYLLWIRPDDGADSPIAVYALQLPAGFPQLPERGANGETTELSEPVEVQGIFFKRWVYPTAEGAAIAPAIIAYAPVWQAKRSSVDTSPSELPWDIIGLCVICAALFAVAVTWRVFRTARNIEVDPEEVLRRYRRGDA